MLHTAPQTRLICRSRLTISVSARIVLFLVSVNASAGDAPKAVTTPSTSHADNLYATFNPVFINRGSKTQDIDLSRFETGNFLLAGQYWMDIFINADWVGRQNIRIINKGRQSRACLKQEQLRDWGVAEDKLTGTTGKEGDCLALEDILPAARLEVDASELQIRLSVPQAFLVRQARGFVDPAYWDSGMTAAFIGYNANTLQSHQQGHKRTQMSVGLNAGANLGDWRIRHNGNYSQSRHKGYSQTRHYASVSNYVQRDLTDLRAQLTFGQYYTASDLFESVPFTGTQISSDDRMLPESQRGFAPAIRGFAETNAKVTVRQSETVLFETTVAPGPFVINDLYNSGYSGDLDVTVEEADGRLNRFTVPYASIAQLLRPGQTRFNVTAGRYRDDALREEPNFFQGSYQRGLSNRWTGYLGGIVAEHYLTVQTGLALNTSLGAIAADVTESHASGLPENDAGLSKKMRGRSYRLTYSKILEYTRTNFTLAAYRFASEGYLKFNDYAQIIGQPLDRDIAIQRERSRFQLNVTQPLPGDGGSFYISGSAQNYWASGKNRDVTFQAGYNRSFSWGNLGLSASRTMNGFSHPENQYLLSLSLPLGTSSAAPYLSSVLGAQDHRYSLQSTLSGTIDEERRFNYSLTNSTQEDTGVRSSSNGANLQYHAASGDFGVSLTKGDDFKQINANAQGTVLAHSKGVTFGPPLSETMALVEAEGAGGATVSNNGIRLDDSGHALVTGLMPYRSNDVSLDPKGSSRNVELETTSQKVAPRYGAIVRMSYPTRNGTPTLFRIRHAEGEPIPVGAEVLDEHGRWLTLVGQGGRIFLRMADKQGRLWVSWGKEGNERCQVSYNLPEAVESKTNPITILDGICRLPANTENAVLLGNR